MFGFGKKKLSLSEEKELSYEQGYLAGKTEAASLMEYAKKELALAQKMSELLESRMTDRIKEIVKDEIMDNLNDAIEDANYELMNELGDMADEALEAEVSGSQA